MKELIDWISGSPVVATVVLIGIGLAVLICIVAFLQNRDIRIFGLAIGAKASAGGPLVQMGDEPFPEADPRAPEFYRRNYKGRVILVRQVEFQPAFKSQPRVSVGLQKLDAGDPGGESKIVRLSVYARSVTPKGFELCFETWDDSVVWNAGAMWIAVGASS